MVNVWVSSWSDFSCGHSRRDLTYWGFEKLAHPLNGIITTQFRPVDCTTKQPLQFDPGFVNQTIYGDRVETGWGWFPYKQNTDTFWSPVRGKRHLTTALAHNCMASMMLCGSCLLPVPPCWPFVWASVGSRKLACNGATCQVSFVRFRLRGFRGVHGDVGTSDRVELEGFR